MQRTFKIQTCFIQCVYKFTFNVTDALRDLVSRVSCVLSSKILNMPHITTYFRMKVIKYPVIERIGVSRIQETWCATIRLCQTVMSRSSTMTPALIGTTTTPSARARATIHSKEQFHSITSVSPGSPYFL